MVEPITAAHLVGGALQPKTGIKAFVFMLWIFFFLATGYAYYIAYVKPHFNPLPTRETIQTAEKIDNTEINYYEPQEQFFIGVRLFGFKLGLTKDKKQLITKEKTTQNVQPVKAPEKVLEKKK